MHTLIIRTRNRNKWLHKAFDSYRSLSYRGTIHIEDDSVSDIFEENKKLIETYKDVLDIKHFKGAGYQEDTRARRVLVTTRKCVERLKTKYFSFTSDDDLFFPSFLKPAVDFLDNNEDYSCVIGPEVKIHYDENFNVVKTTPKYWSGSAYDDPLDRLYDYAINPTLTNYGVCRTSMFDYMTQVEEKTNRVCFGREGVVDFVHFDEEIPWCMLVYAAGKVQYFPHHIMDARGIHYSDIARLINTKKNKEYYLGPIAQLSHPTGWKGILESHEDISTLIRLCKTKYSKDVVDDSVMRFLWARMIVASGSGFLSEDTDFCRNMRERDDNGWLSHIFMKRLKNSYNVRSGRLKTRMAITRSSNLKSYLKNSRPLIDY